MSALPGEVEERRPLAVRDAAARAAVEATRGKGGDGGGGDGGGGGFKGLALPDKDVGKKPAAAAAAGAAAAGKGSAVGCAPDADAAADADACTRVQAVYASAIGALAVLRVFLVRAPAACAASPPLLRGSSPPLLGPPVAGPHAAHAARAALAAVLAGTSVTRARPRPPGLFADWVWALTVIQASTGAGAAASRAGPAGASPPATLLRGTTTRRASRARR